MKGAGGWEGGRVLCVYLLCVCLCCVLSMRMCGPVLCTHARMRMRAWACVRVVWSALLDIPIS
eukprot:JZ550511.1.p3 GENE.JZ550511.1~~JZ550511.1.p3  ORF type:complete len:63 (+),score=1.50 JZ550511.1:166-354(+)